MTTSLKAQAARVRTTTRKPMPPNDSNHLMAVLETKVDALVRQGEENNETLRSLTRAVTQLAVIEERQSADRQAIERSFAEISRMQTQVVSMDRTLDDRLKLLERKEPVNDLSNGFVSKVVWLVVAAVIGGLMTVVLRAPTSAPSFVIQAPTSTQAPAPQQAKPTQ